TDSMDDKFRVCLSSMSKSLESLHICAIRCIMDDRFLHLPAVHELGMPIQKAAGSHGEVPCSHECLRAQSTPLSSIARAKANIPNWIRWSVPRRITIPSCGLHHRGASVSCNGVADDS